MTERDLLRELGLLLARAVYLGMERLYGDGNDLERAQPLWEERGVNASMQAPETEHVETRPVPAEAVAEMEPEPAEETGDSSAGVRTAAGVTELLDRLFLPVEPAPETVDRNESPRPAWAAVREAAEYGGEAPQWPQAAAAVPSGEALRELSGFFERDARRYDGGFEE